ncbi:Tetracycline regulation of excision, RteC [Leadbetterella byssophila DSM 17132]|uniref:Tetracycline regulation of excision, RteC n=1 Tax=Leadbetterella byssophila (strain DSM 17132 / JCM 16389 / KACC 11308 / NBRC 106382 / 4M15) TaxID=649349 RepID=E4RU26_LEAB4|nr:RteC domain-containing protein [Leadbetterella byssophila]ADQ16007.1 Tetracycline regulation of excision, RteC [Leadbetterella byssophila DSM 17132]
MKNSLKKILADTENKLLAIHTQNENAVNVSVLSIEIITQSLIELKQFVINHGFRSEIEEINFFKNVKPSLVSKFIYYNTILHFEAKKDKLTNKCFKKSLQKELKRIKHFSIDNWEFYKYYKMNDTFYDKEYFLRESHKADFIFFDHFFEIDQSFSTTHDYKISRIIANDLIQVYLTDQILRLKQSSLKDSVVEQLNLDWTESKAALIELIYALHSRSVFNNGNIEIKWIAKSFEKMLNIELGDLYHTYLEIRNRKINQTKFLDTLKYSLIKKMEEQDEK